MADVVCCDRWAGLTAATSCRAPPGPTHRLTAWAPPSSGVRTHKMRGEADSSAPARGGEALSGTVGGWLWGWSLRGGGLFYLGDSHPWGSAEWLVLFTLSPAVTSLVGRQPL